MGKEQIDNRLINEEDLSNIPSYEAVDLGLPSGTLWANMNIGARTETDYGKYFAWGDTQGYTREQVGPEKKFNWTDYKLWDGTDSYEACHAIKYNNDDKITTLLPEDDAATVNMGSEWCMPTAEQFEELINNTDSVWVTGYNGNWVNGRLFTSRTDVSKTLFFPASGNCWDGEVREVNTSGTYWLSEVYPNGIYNASYFDFRDIGVWRHTSSISRPLGVTVRGVKKHN